MSILESQDLFILDGSFIKRSADGTIITLTLNTSQDSSKPLFERLEFNLTSDNHRIIPSATYLPGCAMPTFRRHG